MERRLKSFLTLSIIVVAFIACLAIVQTDTSYADGVPVQTFYGKSISAPYFKNMYYQINMGSRFKGAKKVTIKSSNKKVFNPEPLDKDSFKYKMIYGFAKKKGSATITIKVKKSSGTKTYKCKFKTIKYRNPFSSYKLGSKKLQGKFKKSYVAMYKNKAKKAKIRIKGKKGWKVKKIRYERYTYSESGSKTVKKTVKNGGTIKFKPKDQNSDESIMVTMYNKKLKQKVVFTLYMDKY